MNLRRFNRRLVRVITLPARKWPWAVVGTLIAAAGIWGSVMFIKVPLPRLASPAQSSQMLARDGQVIATLHGEQDRRIVPLDKISPYLQVAVVATEDREFFNHKGMSLRAIVRAARANLRDKTIVQGGSTITQQYVRNVFPDIGLQRKYSRKLKEIFWAMRLERRYSKSQILQRYLNTVYFGRGAYGAEAAAQTYFKIPASDLTLGQSAYLAGLIRAPQRFQIDQHPEEAASLRNQVLGSMVANKFVGPGEAQAARAEDLKAQFKPGQSIEVDSPRAGYFVEYVRRMLKREFGLSDEQILSGGLRIQTTLDLRMQDAAEAAVSSTLDRPDDPEAAMVAMDPQGLVRAMVGGRTVDSIDRARGFNFAVDVNGTGGGRPAGSAFKPFALAAFIDEGKSLDSTFSGASPIQIDSPKCRNGDKPWMVANFADSSYGPLNVVQATLKSVNTIYAQIMDAAVSPAKFVDIAGRAGIGIPSFDVGCALTLGTTDVTPMEMARAYTTFAQRGMRPVPLAVLKITRPDGTVLAERSPKMERQIDQNVADTVNFVLKQNIEAGTGTAARLRQPAAGKTGTTQNFQDAWFAGYTPQLTAVVWMGYPPDPTGRIPEMTSVRGRQVTGSSFPATIWKRFMVRALEGTRGTDFPKPRLGGDIVGPRLTQPSTELASAGGQGPAAVPLPPLPDLPSFGTPSNEESPARPLAPPPPPPPPPPPVGAFPSCFPFCN